MSLEQEIEMLPVLLVEAIINHNFFEATNIKKRQEELQKWIRMNTTK